MAMTIEELEKKFPWHCRVLDSKGIALPRMADVLNPQTGDLAIGKDGLVYAFDSLAMSPREFRKKYIVPARQFSKQDPPYGLL